MLFMSRRQTRAYLESAYWCRPYPNNPYRRECINCCRMEAYDETYAGPTDKDAWQGGRVRKGQCDWHRESTLGVWDGDDASHYKTWISLQPRRTI